jgi:uncharacterized protein DUF4124
MRLALLITAALFAAPASAQVYKCVDAAGKTVYSQQPCPAGESSKVISRSAPPEAPEAKPGAKPPANPEQEYRKRQAERAEADKKAAEEDTKAKARAENCTRAREALAQFDMGGRFAGVDAKGEKYFYDDNRIAQEKARAQSLADENCK